MHIYFVYSMRIGGHIQRICVLYLETLIMIMQLNSALPWQTFLRSWFFCWTLSRPGSIPVQPFVRDKTLVDAYYWARHQIKKGLYWSVPTIFPFIYIYIYICFLRILKNYCLFYTYENHKVPKDYVLCMLYNFVQYYLLYQITVRIDKSVGGDVGPTVLEIFQLDHVKILFRNFEKNVFHKQHFKKIMTYRPTDRDG